MKLPKIKDSYNSTINEQLFLTTSDDVMFAFGQLTDLNNRMKTRKDRSLKLWQRKQNSIYTSYDNKSKILIKARKANKNKKKNYSSDWKKQTFFNQTEISDIEASEEIKKNIKIKYDIRYKYNDREPTLTDLISTKNDTFFANTMIKILKDKQNDVFKNHDNYSKSLRHEILLLEKDINKFDDFTMAIEKNRKEHESLLNQRIVENKNLVNLYKKQLQEYNSTIYDIYKILMSMNELKIYAKFVHKLLGGDNEILHCELIGNINFKDFKNYDINSIIQKVLKKTNNLLNAPINRDYKTEIHNFDLSFKDMEDKLVRLFLEKHEYETEISDIKKEGKMTNGKKQEKYNLLKEEYDSLLNEKNESIEEYNKISLSIEEEEIIKFNYSMLIDIYSFLFPKSTTIKNFKDLKVENAFDLKSEVVTPIIYELNNLQDRVDELLKTMEECSDENNELFESILNKRKNENRSLKLLQEKNIIKIKEMIKIKKYKEKLKKIIIKDRNKYNYKYPKKNIKFKPTKVLKTEINSEDLKFLYF